MADLMAIALITGASSGIGLELAQVFAADGVDVILSARSEDKLHALAEEVREKYGVKAGVRARLRRFMTGSRRWGVMWIIW